MAKKKTKIPTPHEISNSPTIIPSQDIDKIKKLQENCVLILVKFSCNFLILSISCDGIIVGEFEIS
jgi:hypothetical protein